MAERASRMVGDLVRVASKAETTNDSIEVRRSRDLWLLLSIDGDGRRSMRQFRTLVYPRRT